MYKTHRLLAVITARGGSKGLPGKNIKQLGGKPMIAWTIQAANESAYIDKVILSSDDDDICRVASEFGCSVPFKRPSHLASDQAGSIPVLIHAVEFLDEEFDAVVLLQPTSPLRTSQDIDRCIELLDIQARTSVVSVSESVKSPAWMYWKEEESAQLSPVLSEESSQGRRQDLRAAYVLNGAIYVIGTQQLVEEKKLVNERTKAHVMSPESSVDIDDIIDFKVAQFILEKEND